MSFSGYLTYLLKDMLRSMLKPGLITRDKRSVPAGQEQCGCQKILFIKILYFLTGIQHGCFDNKRSVS